MLRALGSGMNARNKIMPALLTRSAVSLKRKSVARHWETYRARKEREMGNVTIAQVKRSDHAAPEGMHHYVVTVHFDRPNAAITVQVVATRSAQAITEAKGLAEDFAQIPPAQFTSA
jgi:hypothetical protein